MNRDVSDPGPEPQQQAGDLRLELEAKRAKGQALPQLGREKFVARFHVLYPAPEDEVGGESKATVAQHVDQAAQVGNSKWAGAEHSIGSAGEQGFQEGGIVVRIQLQVCVLDDCVWAAQLLDRAAYGRALTQVVWLTKRLDPGFSSRKVSQDPPGVVARCVVDHDQLADLRACEYALDCERKGGLLVVGRHHYRQDVIATARCWLGVQPLIYACEASGWIATAWQRLGYRVPSFAQDNVPAAAVSTCVRLA